MTSLHPTASNVKASNVKTITFSDDTYAVIDPSAGAVSIHRGRQLGDDSDWGGQCIAWLELDKALAILEAVQALYAPFSGDFSDVLLGDQREDYVGM